MFYCATLDHGEKTIKTELDDDSDVSVYLNGDDSSQSLLGDLYNQLEVVNEDTSGSTVHSSVGTQNKKKGDLHNLFSILLNDIK